jgi:hypothetical protein
VFAVGAGPGGLPVVDVYDAATGALSYQFQAFDTGFTGGTRVAVARDGQGRDVVAVAAGPGGFLVRTFLAGPTGATPIGQIVPFGTLSNGIYQGFTGGIFVALGDLNGDGQLEVVTGPDAAPNSDPFVNVWSLTGTPLSGNIPVFETGFQGGVRVAVGDVDGDGKAEIVGAAGPNGFPYVQEINGQTFQQKARFEAFAHGFRGGVFVATGTLDASGRQRIIVGAGGQDGSAGDAPVLRVLDGLVPAPAPGALPVAVVLRDNTPTYEASYHGGVTVAAARAFGRPLDTVLVGPAARHDPHILANDALFASRTGSFTVLDLAANAADLNFANGVSVA